MNLSRTFIVSTVIGGFLLGGAVASEDPASQKQFVILKSTKDYKEALQTAQKASEVLKIKLDLRGLSENKRIGLTFSEEICKEESGSEFPCYVARGRFDDGDYISIEFSSAFEGFKKDYYIVVASSYPKGSKETSRTLKQARKQFEDAYAKTANVYLGCIH